MKKRALGVLIVSLVCGFGCKTANVHPRLFFGGTKLQDLRAEACYDQNGGEIPGCTPSTDWTIFRDLLAPYLNDGSYYDMQAWHFALAYMVNQDPAYANRAVGLVDGQVADGLDLARSDSYYPAGDCARNVALIYDWLNVRLTAGQKQAYVAYLNQLLTEIWNPFDNPYHTWSGWAIEDPGNNYFYNFLLATAYAGLATEDENPDQPALPFRGTVYTDIPAFLHAKIDEQAIPDWLAAWGRGGGWHEGQNYGLGSKMRISEIFLLMRDEGWRDYFWTLGFPRESLDYQLYSIQPGDRFEYPGGDLARESSMSVSSYDRALMLLLAEGLQGTKEGEYARFWLDQVYPTMEWQFMYAWEFLLDRPGLPGRDYREMPLAYLAEGSGWVNSRSSWTDDAVSVSFVSTDRIQSHQHKDQNSFVIFRGGWQAIDSATFSHSGIPQGSEVHNTILVGGEGQRYGEGTGRILKFENAPEYAYAAGDASDAYYSNPGEFGHGESKLVQTFLREMVQIRPGYVVVFDRVTPADPGSVVTYLLHFQDAPTIHGALVESAAGDGRIFERTLRPSSFVIRVVDEHELDSDLASWRIELEPSVPEPNDQFLNVLFATDAATTEMPPTVRIDSTTGNMTGAHLQDAARGWVILFGANPSGSDVAGPATYSWTATTDVTEHLLLDLSPNEQYGVSSTENGGAFTTTVVRTAGGAYRSSGQGTLKFSQSRGR